MLLVTIGVSQVRLTTTGQSPGESLKSWESLDRNGEGAIKQVSKGIMKASAVSSEKDILFSSINAILIPNAITQKGQPDRVGMPMKKRVST